MLCTYMRRDGANEYIQLMENHSNLLILIMFHSLMRIGSQVLVEIYTENTALLVKSHVILRNISEVVMWKRENNLSYIF